jgi:hypothetical protein
MDSIDLLKDVESNIMSFFQRASVWKKYS